MTTTDYTKVMKQLQDKPGKKLKHAKYSVPKQRTGGAINRKCKRCGRNGGHISKYGINLCRQCFRDVATRIGFKKYN
jgi:small subunit ribosomal protein S14